MTTNWDDDDVLRGRLAEALGEVDVVPADFVGAGTGLFTWRTIDAELAALVYDSDREVAAARSDVASLRALTYATSRATIDITFMPDGMIGQIAPQCTARVQLRYSDGQVAEVVADRLGVFTVDPLPRNPFVLMCRFGDSINIVTPVINP
jgi:hypothetical protein